MSVFICFDIGGTKSHIALYKKKLNSYKLLYSASKQTIKGKRGLKNTLTFLFSNCLAFVIQHNYELDNSIYISMIGDFGLDTVLKQGSASNICAFEGEFDDVCLADFFSDCFASNYKLYIVNDALAQCCGGYYVYNQSKRENFKSVISYLGLGTGLGGAFAEFKKEKGLSFFTDGHVSRVQMKSRLTNSNITAEEVLSAHYFKSIGVLDVKNFLSQANYSQHTRAQLNLLGAHFCDLVDLLFGNITTYHASWAKKDIVKIKQTSLLLIGGSIGVSELTKPFLYDIYFPYLNQTYSNIEIYLITNSFNCATLGAYLYFL
jgi:hypothetical protein